MSKKRDDKLDKIIKTLEEMLKWVKVAYFPHVKKLLLDNLSSDEEKVAYHYSDGRTSREISKLVGVSHKTVTRWWKDWVTAGLAETISVKGGGERAKRTFSLEEFGIEIQQIKRAKRLKKEEETIEKN